jgi:predicted ATPase
VKKIRIQNLRSLQDTNEIEIKPLTVLVGKNSSGKSTFLRFFPLMKQTLETRTHEPILWYSPRYVDFGSFDESINSISEKKTISFEFEFDILTHNFTTFPYYRKNGRVQRNFNYVARHYPESVKTACRVRTELGKRFIHRMVFEIENQSFEITLKDENSCELTLNGVTYSKNFLVNAYVSEMLDFLPRIRVQQKDEISSSEEYFSQRLFEALRDMIPSELNNEVDHQVIEDEAIEGLVPSILFGKSEFILESMKSQEIDSEVLMANLQELSISDPYFKQLENLVVGMYIDRIMSLSNQYLQSYFSSVRYIAPVRASAERYYRIQGLSVDEIDPRGENIPMVLHHMDTYDKNLLNRWLKENFGFQIHSGFTGGHTSLKIEYSNGVQINLADTGFGYSQILPIIIVLWQTTIGRKGRDFIAPNAVSHLTGYKSFFTIAIEQPELHLHPALQGMLIDTFVKVIELCMVNNIDIRIIIETHSETIVNRIGYLIAKNHHNFSDELVNVLIFDNSDDPYVAKLRTSGYNTQGYLTEWPMGFFSPEGI